MPRDVVQRHELLHVAVRLTTKFADECACGFRSQETVPRNEPSLTWMTMNRIALGGAVRLRVVRLRRELVLRGRGRSGARERKRAARARLWLETHVT